MDRVWKIKLTGNIEKTILVIMLYWTKYLLAPSTFWRKKSWGTNQTHTISYILYASVWTSLKVWWCMYWKCSCKIIQTNVFWLHVSWRKKTHPFFSKFQHLHFLSMQMNFGKYSKSHINRKTNKCMSRTTDSRGWFSAKISVNLTDS